MNPAEHGDKGDGRTEWHRIEVFDRLVEFIRANQAQYGVAIESGPNYLEQFKEVMRQSANMRREQAKRDSLHRANASIGKLDAMWHEIVGREAAFFSEPKGVRGDTLNVFIDSEAISIMGVFKSSVLLPKIRAIQHFEHIEQVGISISIFNRFKLSAKEVLLKRIPEVIENAARLQKLIGYDDARFRKWMRTVLEPYGKKPRTVAGWGYRQEFAVRRNTPTDLDEWKSVYYMEGLEKFIAKWLHPRALEDKEKAELERIASFAILRPKRSANDQVDDKWVVAMHNEDVYWFYWKRFEKEFGRIVSEEEALKLLGVARQMAAPGLIGLRG